MELGISIFGALVLVFLLLTFLSAVFAISIVLALTVGIFFTFSFLIQNIEDVDNDQDTEGGDDNSGDDDGGDDGGMQNNTS